MRRIKDICEVGRLREGAEDDRAWNPDPDR